jgi:hypothetical protein
MLLSDLQTLVLTWLDDVNATYFTIPQVNVWLNNAQREVQKQLLQAGENWYAIAATTSTIASQDTYSLPSDFLKMHRLEILTQGPPGPTEVSVPLDPVTLNESNMITLGPSTPGSYYIKKNCLVLRPYPDLVYTMRATYSYLVTDMTDPTQSPDIPLQYQEYLAVLAVLDGLYRDQRDPTNFMGKKQYYLDLMKQDAQSRRQDKPRMVVTTSDSGWGYLY